MKANTQLWMIHTKPSSSDRSMQLFKLVDEERVDYIVFQHPEGYTAYPYKDIGGNLVPAMQAMKGCTIEQVAATLSSIYLDDRTYKIVRC